MADNVVSLSPPSVHVEPPAGVTEEQAQAWRETVSARSADFFGPDQVPMLAEYCRAVVTCRLLGAQIEAAFAGGDPVELKAALDMRDKESRRLASLATKLRLTN